ncbi:zinc finger protein Xfin [Aplysia californica]|uniref:Zinc finger protein Xfin n=1 Tax=Aplysia californica TaxID=6500 RepID=A0ABM0JMZ1_APLCA|nr:zinc finger protein Xfin [Aplysia californica]
MNRLVDMSLKPINSFGEGAMEESHRDIQNSGKNEKGRNSPDSIQFPVSSLAAKTAERGDGDLGGLPLCYTSLDREGGQKAGQGSKGQMSQCTSRSLSQHSSLSKNETPSTTIDFEDSFKGDSCESRYKLPTHNTQTEPCVSKEDPSSPTVTRSVSESSLVGEGSLGATLANSLKLISTNNLPVAESPVQSRQLPSAPSSPKSETLLIEAPIHSDGDTMLYGETDTCVGKDYPVEHSSPAFQPRRYKTRSATTGEKTVASSKTKGRKRQRGKSPSSTPGSPTNASRDGSATMYQCEECCKMFHRKQTLKQHFITHTDRFPCPYCKVRCKSKGDLKTHIQTHTKEKPYHCDVCNTNYTRESILKKHQTTQTHKKAVMALDKVPKVGRAGTEPRKGTNTAKLSLTGQSEVKLEGVPCEKCERVFSSKAALRKHEKVHSLKFKCKLCRRRCLSSTLLKIHMKRHDKHDSLLCKICSRSFFNHFLLKEHMKSHKTIRMVAFGKSDRKSACGKFGWKEVGQHESPFVKPGGRPPKVAKWSCHMCSKAYINKKSLENHEKVHHCYSCTICEKRYPTLSKLKMHMKLHGKPYKCDVCESPFFDQSEFKEHVEKHHVPHDDLKCKICYKKFESATDLQFHMQNHAPTMLFSGACLDESSIPVHNKNKKFVHSGSAVCKLSDSDCSSDNEEDTDLARKSGKSDNTNAHKLLNDNAFLELFGSVVLELTRPDTNTEEYDSDDELLATIKVIVESDSPDSPCVSDGEEQPHVGDYIIYTQEQILDKHNDQFTLHSEIDAGKTTFVCKLCHCTFKDSLLLQQHFLGHVCECCNNFYPQKEDLRCHREEHRKQLIVRMKDEANCLEPSLKESFSWESSDTGDDEESDGFLSEMENVLDCKSHKTYSTVLQALSHDEIIKANKKTFERYSCIDTSSSIFACTICKRKYARPTTLTRHFKTHVCPFCNQFFEDKADLLEHKYRHRKESSAPTVDVCGEKKKGPASPLVSKVNREFFKKFSFVDSQHNINRCTLCCKNFVRRTVLTRHMKTHICSHCDKFFEDKYDLAKHVVTHRSDMYYSDCDNDDFAEYEEDDERPFAGHSAVADRGKLVSIPSAFSTGLSHFTPAFHTQTAMSEENQTLTFIQIPASEGGEAADPQMYTSTTPGGSTFQIISEPDSNPESFLVAPTNGAAVDPGKIITISQSQIVPDENDDRQRLFECGDCGKRFFKNGHLKSHMLIHSGDKPYACRLCGKSFSRSTTLRKHEKTHMKRCKICDSTFNYKYELDIHMEIHRTYAFYK